MRSSSRGVRDVLAQHAAKASSGQQDDMIEALAVSGAPTRKWTMVTFDCRADLLAVRMTAGAARLGLIAGLLAVVAAVLTVPSVGHVALTARMCAFHGASLYGHAGIAASGIPSRRQVASAHPAAVVFYVASAVCDETPTRRTGKAHAFRFFASDGPTSSDQNPRPNWI